MLVLLISRGADEDVPVYIKLRIRTSDEKELRSRLSRLEVGLDAFASNYVDSQSPREGVEASRDLVFSTEVSNGPQLIRQTATGDTLAVWRVRATIHRPRMRFPSPTISFVARTTLLPLKTLFSDADEDLQSFVPLAPNLLASLGYGESDAGITPSNISVPQVSTYGSQRIRHEPARRIRVVSAANARIRYSRLNAFQKRPITIASLDFEVAPFLEYRLELTNSLLELSNGGVEDLANQDTPIPCRPRDTVTFMYKLYPSYGADSLSSSTTSNLGTIVISLTALIHLSSTYHATICLNWTTHVDFSTPVNPMFGAPSQAMQRSNRPVSLPVRSRSGSNTTTHTAKFALSDAPLVISFSGPSTVEVGRPFQWEVFIVNRGTKSQKFAIVAIPTRRRAEISRHAAKSSSASSARDSGLSASRHTKEDFATAVVDENVLLATQRSTGVGAAGTELICLSPDVRVGPLAPGSCHITELRLLSLAPGSLRPEVVRIVDVGTGEATDIRDLPDIVAVEPGRSWL